MPNFLRFAGLVLFGGVLGLHACSDAAVSDGTGADGASGPDEPVVVIVSPESGQAFSHDPGGTQVPVQLELRHLALGDPGDGVALTLDGQPAGLLRASSGVITVGAAGLHTLAAQAVDADGAPYDSATARDSVQFAVVAPCSDVSDCDDSNPCSVESCEDGLCAYAVVEGCCLGPDDCAAGQSCVDNQCSGGAGGILCKTDVDCQGALSGGEALAVCMREACGPDGVCLITDADGAPCDDGDPCTGTGVCAGDTCASGPALVCDDGDPCTDDGCGASGCESAPATGPACDDGDACTKGDVCTGGVCAGTPDGACQQIPGETVCELSGAVDDEVVCMLRMARTAKAVPLPVALQLTLHYDPSALQLVRLQDESCITGTCQDLPVPPAPLWPSGHSVALAPGQPEAWAGKGSLVISNFSDPLAAISEAWLDGSEMQGDPLFVEVVFRRAKAGTDPVKATNIVVSDATAAPIDVAVADTLILVGEPGAEPASDVVCAIHGDAGDEVDCPIRLVAASELAPKATALEMVVSYPTESLEMVGFFDELCFEGAGCFDQQAGGQGGQPLSTGHSVNIAPVSYAQWNGSGAAILVNPADPTRPLTEAWLDASSEVVGDPVVMRARFVLSVNIPASTQASVTISDLVAADGDAASVAVTLEGGLIVTGE